VRILWVPDARIIVCVRADVTKRGLSPLKDVLGDPGSIIRELSFIENLGPHMGVVVVVCEIEPVRSSIFRQEDPLLVLEQKSDIGRHGIDTNHGIIPILRKLGINRRHHRIIRPLVDGF